MKHPYILKPLVKENGYPDIKRLGRGFQDYLQIYDPIAEKIRNNSSLVTIDANIASAVSHLKQINLTLGNHMETCRRYVTSLSVEE